MIEIYIVVKIGPEGIESLGKGFIDSKKAIEYITKQRSKYDNPSEEDEETSFYFFLKQEAKDPERAERWLERQKRAYCIQRDSGDGFECVCKTLGVNLDGEMVLY